MADNLVIVESPAKARTISRILKGSYAIKATLGHVRDLPEKELGVDTENGFAPVYVVPKGKKKAVKEIKAAAKDASVLYLATDPDREGEAISWHLIQAANLGKMPAKRVIFHEITEEAIKEAFRRPKRINMKLVNAQQARRILDRLVGYKISPILWRKVRKGLSAGRVQSVAVRMIVEREREIEGFVPTEYWTIEADLKKKGKGAVFRAELIGLSKGKKLTINKEQDATKLISHLEKATYKVSKVQHKEIARQPVAPFITSTLQQEAWRKLRFGTRRTMSIAQALYEGIPMDREDSIGLITYMRTDSTHVAAQAIKETRDYIAEKHGPDFVPKSPRIFRKKVKGAQEAHEAIRPTSVRREPVMMQPHLTDEQFKLYDLIWKRMVSSQMAAAVFDNTTIDIEASTEANKYILRAGSSNLKFLGFLMLYSEGSDDDENGKGKAQLPDLVQGDALDLLKLFPEQHFTKPPNRFTEATLVKALEENGIGRPSTYAPILSTIQERDYVVREKGHFKPNEIGFIVTDLLKDHFQEIVDIGFTAQMEERLDEISSGEREWIPTLETFYEPFAVEVEKAASNMPKVKPLPEPTDEVCEKCGSQMVIRSGRFGKFMSCSGFPSCKNTKPLLVKIEAKCPRCESKLVERRTKKRRIFYGCSNYPQCDFAIWERPLPTPCPKCGGLLVPKDTICKCAKCEYEGNIKDLQKKELAPTKE